MEWFAWAARCLLSALFAVAAWRKLARPAATQAAVTALLGLEGRPMRLIAAMLPAAELGLAALLIPAPAAPWAAGAALGLLGSFTFVIALALARGERPPCACFGADAVPIAYSTLARNVALIGLTVLVLLGAWRHPGLSLPLNEALTVAALAVAGALLARQQAELRELRARADHWPRRHPRAAGRRRPLLRAPSRRSASGAHSSLPLNARTRSIASGR